MRMLHDITNAHLVRLIDASSATVQMALQMDRAVLRMAAFGGVQRLLGSVHPSVYGSALCCQYVGVSSASCHQHVGV